MILCHKSKNRSPAATIRSIKLPKALFFLSLILVFGCAATPPEPAAEPEPPAAEPAGPLIPLAQLNQMLTAADNALHNEHLTFPKQGSALQIYEEILALDPHQEDAQRGIEHIVERYVELSLAALPREQYATARSMLARARLILPDHPSIEPTAQQIRLLESAQRKRMSLAPATLANRDSLTRELAPLVSSDSTPAAAEKSSISECRFKIWARSDREGREIYQALSHAYAQALGVSQDETPRLRAQLGVRSPASIERMCFM